MAVLTWVDLRYGNTQQAEEDHEGEMSILQVLHSKHALRDRLWICNTGQRQQVMQGRQYVVSDFIHYIPGNQRFAVLNSHTLSHTQTEM